ncbi:MAG: hypothetical protein V4695_02400 [Pseudomonadota bacterium]
MNATEYLKPILPATPKKMPTSTRSSNALKSLFKGASAPPGFESQLELWKNESPDTDERQARREIAKQITRAGKKNSAVLKIECPQKFKSSIENEMPYSWVSSFPKCFNHLNDLKNFEISLNYFNAKIHYFTTRPDFPALPPYLIKLKLDNVIIGELPPLPQTLKNIAINRSTLKKLPPLPNKLLHLDVRSNEIEHLPALPDSLITLYASKNKLKFLQSLPPHLETLAVSGNKLKFLPYLPQTCENLDASWGDLSTVKFCPGHYRWRSGENVGYYSPESAAGVRAISQASDYKKWQKRHFPQISLQNIKVTASVLPEEQAKNFFYDRAIKWIDNLDVSDIRSKEISYDRVKIVSEVLASGDGSNLTLTFSELDSPPNFLHLMPAVKNLSLDYWFSKGYPEKLPALPPNLTALEFNTRSCKGSFCPTLPNLPATLKKFTLPKDYYEEERGHLIQKANPNNFAIRPLNSSQELGSFIYLPSEIFNKILDLTADDHRNLVNLSATNSDFNHLLERRVAAVHANAQLKILTQCTLEITDDKSRHLDALGRLCYTLGGLVG